MLFLFYELIAQMVTCEPPLQIVSCFCVLCSAGHLRLALITRYTKLVRGPVGKGSIMCELVQLSNTLSNSLRLPQKGQGRKEKNELQSFVKDRT